MRAGLACVRRWWFDQRSGLAKPQATPAQAEGQAIHAAVEAAWTSGQPPAEDRRAQALYLRLCDLTGERQATLHLRAEVPIRIETLDIPVVGFVDLLDTTQLLTHGLVRVVDYKTTSDWQYAKSVEQLQNDTQMLTYAAHAVELGAERVELVHLVVHKKTAEVREIRAMTTADDVALWWERRATPLLQTLTQAAQIASADEAPATTSACGLFGGCQWLAECTEGTAKTTERPYKNIGARDMSTLRDLIRQRAAQGSSSPASASNLATPTSTAPPPVEPPAVAPKAQQSLSVDAPAPAKPRAAAAGAYDYAAGGLAIVVHLEQSPAGPKGAVSAAKLKEVVGAALGLQRVAWQHVEASVAEAGLSDRLGPSGLAVAPWVPAAPAAVVNDANPSGWPDPTPEAPPVVEAPPIAVAAVVEAPPVVVVEAPVEAPPVVAVAPVEAPPVVAPPAVVRSLALYIDCVPDCAHITLERYVAPHVERLSAVAGCSLFTLDYRQGERQLAAAVAADCEAGTHPSALVVSSSHAAWRELQQPLLAAATLVVRGVR